MIKNKDEVDMKYIHYLRAVLSAKRRKEKRLISELEQILRDKNEIKRRIKDIMEEKNDKTQG